MFHHKVRAWRFVFPRTHHNREQSLVDSYNDRCLTSACELGYLAAHSYSDHQVGMSRMQGLPHTRASASDRRVGISRR